MANKFLDEQGLSYLLRRLKYKFVENQAGKMLSSNDYTSTEKAKLSTIEENANRTHIVDSLNSTLRTSALSAYQGRLLNEKINNLGTSLEGTGNGDMLKKIYDSDADGIVDTAENALKFGGAYPVAYVQQSEIKTVAKTGSFNDLADRPESFPPSVHSHEAADIVGAEELISHITDIANGKCKSFVFDTVSDMEVWLADSLNTAGLKTGDVFLIRALNVPDYWWDGTSVQTLETTKVDLTGYAKTSDLSEAVSGLNGLTFVTSHSVPTVDDESIITFVIEG